MALQHRRGTPEEWKQYNEVLADGQLGISWNRKVDSHPIVKVGNGQDVFSELPEVSGSGGGSSNVIVKNTIPEDSEGEDGDICFVVGD